MSEERIAVLEAVLRDCRDYFDKRADATWPKGREVPNEEMKILSRIREVLG